VRKHARADAVDIDVEPSADGIQIVIKDNGTGFDLTRTPEGHFGLEIMRERAESVGGTVEIDSRLGAGTRVGIWVPGMEAEKRLHGLVH
jgi:signal transduction histidine kinase